MANDSQLNSKWIGLVAILVLAQYEWPALASHKSFRDAIASHTTESLHLSSLVPDSGKSGTGPQTMVFPVVKTFCIPSVKVHINVIHIGKTNARSSFFHSKPIYPTIVGICMNTV